MVEYSRVYGAVSPNYRPQEREVRWTTILMGMISCGLILGEHFFCF